MATHQIIKPGLKWKKKKKIKWRGAESGLEREGLRGEGEEDAGWGNNNNNSEGLGIDRAIRKSI